MDEDVRFKDDRHFVTSLARGLRIISAFGPGDRSLENAELARRTGLPRGTVARFTHTLTQLGYMAAHKGARGHSLAPRVLELGQAAAISIALRDVARPAMKALSELGSFSVALGVASDRGIRYIDIAKRPEAVVLNLEPGAIIPIPPSAIGRAWLGALEAERRTEVMARLKATDPGLWTRHAEAVARETERFAVQGYTLSIGEWWPELNAAATAITLPDGGGPLVLNIGGLSSILSRDALVDEFAPALIATARMIEAGLRRGFVK